MRTVAATVFALTLPLGAMTVPATAQVADNSVVDTSQDQPFQPAQEESNRIIVKFRDKQDDRDARMALINKVVAKHYTGEVKFNRTMFDGAYVIDFNEKLSKDVLDSINKELSDAPEVDVASASRWVGPITPPTPVTKESDLDGIKAAPNDPDYSKQWHLTAQYGANVQKTWDELGITGKGQVIGIVDSGLTHHTDLDSKQIGGIDMIRGANDNDPTPGRDTDYLDTGDWHDVGVCGSNDPGGYSVWHGTHVAGIAAAATNNSRGVAGVARDANFTMSRALGTCGGDIADIADAMAWSAGYEFGGDTPINPNPARVINMSLGGESYGCDPIYQRAIDASLALGAFLLVAAGNDNRDTRNITPANCRGVMVIGATGPEGYRSNFSNWGAEVDLGAPGGNSMPKGWDYVNNRPVVHVPTAGIWSTVNLGQFGPGMEGYTYMDGTSMATPVVAGIAAMMLEANPNLTATRMQQILMSTARPYQQEPTDSYGNSADKTATKMGAGLVDSYAAVCQALKDAGKSCGTAAVTTSAPAPVVTVTPTITSTKTVTSTAPGGTTTLTKTTTAEPVTKTATVTSKVPTTVVKTTTVNGAPVTTTVTETVPTTITTTSVEPVVTTTEHHTTTATPAPVTVTKVVPTTVNGAPTTVTETDVVEAPVATEIKEVPTTVVKTTTVNGAPVTTTVTEMVPTTVAGPIKTETEVIPTTVVKTTTINGVPTTVTSTQSVPTTVTAAPVTTTVSTTTTVVNNATATETTTTTVAGAPVDNPNDNGEAPTPDTKAKGSNWLLPILLGGLLGALLNGPTIMSWAQNLGLLPNPENTPQRNMLGIASLFGGIAAIVATWMATQNGDGATGSSNR